jgi:DNA-binding transcriptional LysR family regulator
MELRHLRYFVAVAEELHFSRAASRLNVVQPALSQQIQQLERELGVTLLARTKRRVAITEPGRAFLAEARRTLANAEHAMRVARNAAAGEVGRLSVGYVDLATWRVLPGVLRTYRRRFPRVELTLIEQHRDLQRDALLRGDLDIGFFSLRDNEGPLSGVRVVNDPLVAAVPREHHLARRTRIPLRALAEEPWVLFSRELRTVYADLVLVACAAAGFTPRVVQEAGQMQTVRSLVSAGFGVTLLPGSMARASRGSAEAIAYRPLTGRAPRLPLHVVWRTGDLSPAGQQLVEVVREVGDT